MQSSIGWCCPIVMLHGVRYNKSPAFECRNRWAHVNSLCTVKHHSLMTLCLECGICLQHCLASKGWKIVIADESHTLRTSERAPDASHTEAAISAVRRTRRAIFLTGTPSLSRPFDLFRQVRFQEPCMTANDATYPHCSLHSAMPCKVECNQR